MNFSVSSEFSKELKRYSKRYRSLPSDLENFKVLISSSEQLESLQFFQGGQATKLIVADNYEVVKARLDCIDLGNKQLLRIVYMRMGNNFLFIELFTKNEKSREDQQRIQRYVKEL